MKTNWVKSQPHPDILLPTTFSLLHDMTSKNTSQRQGPTLLTRNSRSNSIAFTKRIKNSLAVS